MTKGPCRYQQGPSRVGLKPSLEDELEAELDLARDVALAVVGVEHAEVLPRRVRVGAAEERRVEDVEGFGAELEAHALGEDERLVQRHVELPRRGLAEVAEPERDC